MNLPSFEPFKTKMVEPIYKSSRAEREKWITDAHFNLFNLMRSFPDRFWQRSSSSKEASEAYPASFYGSAGKGIVRF